MKGTKQDPYQNVGSCDGICPLRGTRCSPCPQLSTEDNRTPIVEGLRLFNYYDGRWGTVSHIREDGWFHLNYESGHDVVNGVRCSTTEVG